MFRGVILGGIPLFLGCNFRGYTIIFRGVILGGIPLFLGV